MWRGPQASFGELQRGQRARSDKRPTEGSHDLPHRGEREAAAARCAREIDRYAAVRDRRDAPGDDDRGRHATAALRRQGAVVRRRQSEGGARRGRRGRDSARRRGRRPRHVVGEAGPRGARGDLGRVGGREARHHRADEGVPRHGTRQGGGHGGHQRRCRRRARARCPSRGGGVRVPVPRACAHGAADRGVPAHAAEVRDLGRLPVPDGRPGECGKPGGAET